MKSGASDSTAQGWPSSSSSPASRSRVDARLEAVGEQPRRHGARVVLLEEDRPHRGIIPASGARNGRSGSSQSTSSRSSAPSQRSRSCSVGSGSPATSTAVATRSSWVSPIGRRARQPGGHRDGAAQLLGDLADQRGVGGLAGLDLAAGELPAARGRGRRRTTGRQDASVTDDRGPHDGDARLVGHAVDPNQRGSGVGTADDRRGARDYGGAMREAGEPLPRRQAGPEEPRARTSRACTCSAPTTTSARSRPWPRCSASRRGWTACWPT